MLSFGFRIFCWYRGFCHRTWSDLLLFLSLSRSFVETTIKANKIGPHNRDWDALAGKCIDDRMR